MHQGLAFRGIGIDQGLSQNASDGCALSACGSSVRLVRMGAREDLEVIRQARELLTG